MNPLFEILDAAERERLITLAADSRRPVDPERTGPHGVMLATLSHDVVTGPDWVYERKLDGERCIAVRIGSDVRLSSRNGQRLNDTYPELTEALAVQDCDDFVVDGEVVAFDGQQTSFRLLQQRMQQHGAAAAKAEVPVFFYLFDIPWLLGRDCRALHLRSRKLLLSRALDFTDPLRLTTHRDGAGAELLREACDAGWEGLIAKRIESHYSNGRSRDWLKLKCEHRQEFVIGGFSEPRGSRPGFGALVVGFYEGDALVCAGKVGTGFDNQTLHELRAELDGLAQDEPSFDRGELPADSLHWVQPVLVAEVAFTEWTRDGRLRHPRFLGLRRDKPAREVVREDKPAGG